MIPSYLAGLGASLGLIVAIGAQNAFVLRQGIKREWVLPVVLVCMASDAVLIFAGVAFIVGLVVLPKHERALRRGVVVYSLATTAALLVSTPMGSNAVRLGALVGGLHSLDG